jgi:hypothetical protein
MGMHLPVAYLAQLPMLLHNSLTARCIRAKAIPHVPRHKVAEEIAVQRRAHVRQAETVRLLRSISESSAATSRCVHGHNGVTGIPASYLAVA